MWLLQAMTMLLTPAHWVDISGGWLTPIVVRIGPPVKVDQQFPLLVHLSHGGNTHQGRVRSVLRLQLHASFEVLSTRTTRTGCS